MRSLLTVGAAIGLAAICAPAHAATIWYQMPMDQLGSVPSQQTGAASLATRAADDFVLPAGNGQPYMMGGIRARMISMLGNDPTKYRMEIFADAAGLPGDLLIQRTAYQVNGFGVDFRGKPIVQPAFLGDYDLPAGQRYWLSIYGVGEGNLAARFSSYNFGAAAPVLGDAVYRIGDGAWTTARSTVDVGIRDLAFVVDGTQRVPAPGAAGLLALGLLGALRRRR